MCNFKHNHHHRIVSLLNRLNADFLKKADCFFGGGTAIVLLLNEYRQSVDIDFIISSRQGYAMIREAIHAHGLAGIMLDAVPLHGDIRTDRDKIQMWLNPDDQRAIKLEIVYEARIDVTGETSPWGIPVLSKVDMYAEKLLANADRWHDKSSSNRDILDIAMMLEHWGPIPSQAWQKTTEIYGQSIYHAFIKAIMRLEDQRYLKQCIHSMQFEAEGQAMLTRLHQQIHTLKDKCIDRSLISDCIDTHIQKAIDTVSKPFGLSPSTALKHYLFQLSETYTAQIPNLEDGMYYGPILWADDHYVVQSLSHNIFTIHVCHDWFPKPNTEETLCIRYQYGISYPHTK